METNKTRTKRREALRANEVADELSIGLSTVWLYAKEGKITPNKISARVTVFSIDEINRVFNTDIKKEIEVQVIQKQYKDSSKNIEYLLHKYGKYD